MSVKELLTKLSLRFPPNNERLDRVSSSGHHPVPSQSRDETTLYVEMTLHRGESPNSLTLAPFGTRQEVMLTDSRVAGRRIEERVVVPLAGCYGYGNSQVVQVLAANTTAVAYIRKGPGAKDRPTTVQDMPRFAHFARAQSMTFVTEIDGVVYSGRNVVLKDAQS